MRASDPWTTDRLRARLSEAARTMRIVQTSSGPSNSVTWWPDTVASVMEAYGYHPETVPKMRADPDQIGRMDEAQRWIAGYLTIDACTAAGLVPDGGFVVAGRAQDWSWERIGRARKVRYGAVGDTLRMGPATRLPGGNSRKSLMLIERRTLAWLATQLNRLNVEVDRRTLADKPPAPSDQRDRRGGDTIAPARLHVVLEQPED